MSNSLEKVKKSHCVGILGANKQEMQYIRASDDHDNADACN